MPGMRFLPGIGLPHSQKLLLFDICSLWTVHIAGNMWRPQPVVFIAQLFLSLVNFIKHVIISSKEVPALRIMTRAV